MNMLFIYLCVMFLMHEVSTGPICNANNNRNELESDAVARFREYLRIDTSKEENLEYGLEFWIRQATELGLPFKVYAPAGKPIFVATLEGSNIRLPSIMLNSHMDVVSADEREWTYPPFEAHMEANGDIFARGAQDTKDVAIQYFEAIRRIKKQNITLARTLHFTLMPDEETGGENGMKAFLKTKEFKSLNIGFALDEGLISTDDILFATYTDRRPWHMNFTFHGGSGHGATIPDGTAMEKVHKFIDTVMTYREGQKKIFKSNSTNYNSVNINILDGGLVPNVIPATMSLVIDMRLSPDADSQEIQNMVDSWISESGNQTEVKFIRQEKVSGVTPVDDSNAFWVTMNNTITKMGLKIIPIVCPATSDMLVLRNLGIPALGFSTKTNTISRMHGKDEYQNVATFEKGIDIYTELIKDIANTI